MDPVTVARFLSIPTAFMMTGFSIAASQSTLPLIYDQPASVSLKIFKGVYHRGAVMVVPAALVSTAATAYLAYKFPAQRTALGSAAAVTLSWMPFTILIMSGGINRLLEIGANAVEMEKAGRSGEVLRLLKAWTFQNAVRGSLAFIGGSIVLWNSLGN